MEKKRKLSIFWIFMFAYMGVWLIATGVISTKLWTFCSSYQRDYDLAVEKSNPDLVMDLTLKRFEGDNILSLVTDQFDGISELENIENAKKMLTKLSDPEMLRYERVENFSNRKPLYMVYSNDTLLGEVKMKQIAASDSFGFHMCEVTETNLLWNGILLISKDIEAPISSRVYVNGIELDDSYVTSTNLINTQMSKKAANLTGKSFGTKVYHIDGFVKEPTIEYEKEVITNLEDSLKELVLEANEAYIKNMNLLLSFDALRKYLEPNGAAVANIQSAQSGLAWSGKPDKLEIKKMEISDVKSYSEDVMVVTTKSNVYRLYRNVEYNEEMNYEWLYVRSGNTWKISDFSYAN